MQFKDAHLSRQVIHSPAVGSPEEVWEVLGLESTSSADLQEMVTAGDGSIDRSDLTPCDQAGTLLNT